VSFDLTALAIIGPGLVAGVLVLATHVPLGREVLKRGIIFIDLAVAQMAGLGVIAAGTFGLETHGIGAQVAAFAAALLGVLLLLANNPHGGEELRDLLVGQMLFADVHTLTPAAVLAVAVLASWRLVMRTFGRPGFYLLFAVSVTASVQLVGVYLVFASLMVPALATRSLGVHALAAGYAVGLVGYVGGLLLSAVYDLPTGAVIVWTLTLAGLAAVPLLARWRSRGESARPAEANRRG